MSLATRNDAVSPTPDTRTLFCLKEMRFAAPCKICEITLCERSVYKEMTMKRKLKIPILLVIGGISVLPLKARLVAAPVRLEGPNDIPVGRGANNLQINVVAEGPATRNTPLQIACFFAHQKEGDTYSGGTGDFVLKTRGLIKSLRDRDEFSGEELETLLITPPAQSVPAKKLLLIGLGDPADFTAERMRRVGKVALREALRLGVTRVSFSPNVTDGGVHTVPVKDYDRATIEGVLLAYDTEKRLQKEGVNPRQTLEEFTLEAGHDNVNAAKDAIREAIKNADVQIGRRPGEAYVLPARH